MANKILDLFSNDNAALTADKADAVGTGLLKGTDNTVMIWGDLGGGTVTIQLSPVDGVWLDTTISATAAGIFPLGLQSRVIGLKIRAVLSGSSAASVHAEIR